CSRTVCSPLSPFFFTDTATTEIYTLSLHDALPICTSLSTIRRAKPSTIAVLPTPGSPIRIGLFFVFLDKILITRRISSSRPITRSEEHTSELQSRENLVCRLLLEKKKKKNRENKKK